MDKIRSNDIVVLSHVQLKHTQVETKNTKMFMEAQSGVHKIKRLKAEEFKLKKILNDLQQKYLNLQENIGLLGKETKLPS